MYQIKLNREKCDGCGLCEKIYPTNWKIMDKKAHFFKFRLFSLGGNKKVADQCPRKAITIVQK